MSSSRSFLLAAALVAGAFSVPAVGDGEKVQLKLALPKGERFAIELALKSKSAMNLGGMDMDTDIEMTMFVVNAVDGTDEQGVTSMRSRVARVHGKFSNPMMGEMAFDSDKPDDGADSNPMAGMITKQFSQSVGKDTVVKMSADGSMLPSGPEDTGAEMLKQAGAGKLPDHPVGVGDSWKDESDVGASGMKLKVKLTSTVTAIDADTVTIAVDGAMETVATPAGKEADPNPMAKILEKMKITSSKFAGTKRMSRKDGYVLSSDIDSQVEMSIEADPNDENPMLQGGAKISTSQKMHVERKPAPPEEAAKPAGAEPAKPVAHEFKKIAPTANYALRVCVVSGEELGGMGERVAYSYDGEEVQFCCADCVETFQKSPETYLAKVRAAKK